MSNYPIMTIRAIGVVPFFLANRRASERDLRRFRAMRNNRQALFRRPTPGAGFCASLSTKKGAALLVLLLESFVLDRQAPDPTWSTPHHLVVLVGEDVTVPHVAALACRRSP